MSSSTKQKKAAAKSRRKMREANAGKPKKRNLLEEKLGETQRALLNMRQLLDTEQQKNLALRAQLAQRDQILTAASLNDGSLQIPRDDFNLVLEGKVAGYNLELEDEEVIELTPVWPEDLLVEDPEDG